MARRILIVDDDPETTDVLEDILKSHEFEVSKAHDGIQAFEITQSEKIDLIVMDVCMPHFSGLWFCGVFHEREETSKIPIVIISGLEEEDNRDKALEMGAVAFLKKPFPPRELIDILTKTLAR